MFAQAQNPDPSVVFPGFEGEDLAVRKGLARAVEEDLALVGSLQMQVKIGDYDEDTRTRGTYVFDRESLEPAGTARVTTARAATACDGDRVSGGDNQQAVMVQRTNVAKAHFCAAASPRLQKRQRPSLSLDQKLRHL